MSEQYQISKSTGPTVQPTTVNEVVPITEVQTVTQLWNSAYEKEASKVMLADIVRKIHLLTTPTRQGDDIGVDLVKIDEAIKIYRYTRTRQLSIPLIQKAIDNKKLSDVKTPPPKDGGEKRPRDEESPPTIAKKPSPSPPLKCRIIVSPQLAKTLSVDDYTFMNGLRQLDGGWSGNGKESRLLVEFNENDDKISTIETLMKMGVIIEFV